MIKKKIFSLFLLIAFYLLPVCGQKDIANGKQLKDESRNNNFGLFESDDLLKASLSFDLTSYLKKNFKEPLDAVLTFNLSETDSLTKKVKVSNRGNFRSTNCNYPPLEIDFKKPIHKNAGGGKIDKLKLVTRCESGNMYDDYILREYLVYKLYNVLTDNSFRVRLVNLVFIDSHKKKKPIKQFGFFVEPKELLAERTNSTLLKTAYLNQSHIIAEVMDQVAIFNYMISNYDWSLAGQHNVTVTLPIKSKASQLCMAIPFDFDGTGIVNAEYAVPKPETGLKSIRDRIFMGPCRNKQVFQEELKKFLNKKPELYRVINEFQYLDQRSKKDIIGFLDEFFNQIEKQKTLDNLISNFMKNCKAL